MWVWSYPGVDGDIRNLLMKKCNLDKLSEEGAGKDEVDVLAYSFGHFFQIWYYLLNFRVPENTSLKNVYQTFNMVNSLFLIRHAVLCH